MELPDTGKQCSINTCRKLDFLPFKCQRCAETFCKDHSTFDNHNCKNKPIDKHVPVCPICQEIIPLKVGKTSDELVDAHIQNGCVKPFVDKAYVNVCGYNQCKTKTLVPMICHGCNINHCIKHRLEVDHQCKGNSKKVITKNRNQKANADRGCLVC